MKSNQKRQLISTIKTGLISAFITASFMYFFYYPGWQSIAAGLCIGFFIPFILSYYANHVVRKYLVKTNLLILLSINTAIHLIVIFSVAVIFVVIFYMQGNFKAVFTDFQFLYSRLFMIGMGFGISLALIFNFFYILNTLIGKNILGKLFIGMYRKPIEVDRVFMFLDIKSSTTIAEKIGHLKFLSLVNDFFYDITESVYETKGEIYKYVGDEAIITWKTKDAVIDANCVHCFYLAQETIRKKSEYYQKKYGIVPEFKAGLHGGLAVTGELGYTKREIAYMGDVLNTTARIEEACKTFNESLLISEDLISKMKHQSTYFFKEVGKEKLRGKEKEMILFTTSEK